VPRPIVGIGIVERRPKDLVVHLALDDGETLTVAGEDFFDPDMPFDDVVAVFGFLIMQNPPQELLVSALAAFDPEWERKVGERKRQNDKDSAIARGKPTSEEVEQSRRAQLKEDFRRERGAR